MKKLLLLLITFSANTSFAGNSSCYLKVFSTTPESPVIIHYLKYQELSGEQCDRLCASKPKLQREIPFDEMVYFCIMKFKNNDGSITKKRYNHFFSNPY